MYTLCKVKVNILEEFIRQFSPSTPNAYSQECNFVNLGWTKMETFNPGWEIPGYLGDL